MSNTPVQSPLHTHTYFNNNRKIATAGYHSKGITLRGARHATLWQAKICRVPCNYCVTKSNFLSSIARTGLKWRACVRFGGKNVYSVAMATVYCTVFIALVTEATLVWNPIGYQKLFSSRCSANTQWIKTRSKCCDWTPQGLFTCEVGVLSVCFYLYHYLLQLQWPFYTHCLSFMLL